MDLRSRKELEQRLFQHLMVSARAAGLRLTPKQQAYLRSLVARLVKGTKHPEERGTEKRLMARLDEGLAVLLEPRPVPALAGKKERTRALERAVGGKRRLEAATPRFGVGPGGPRVRIGGVLVAPAKPKISFGRAIPRPGGVLVTTAKPKLKIRFSGTLPRPGGVRLGGAGLKSRGMPILLGRPAGGTAGVFRQIERIGGRLDPELEELIREAPESPAEPIDFSAPDFEGEPLEPPPIPADEPEPGPALERSPSPPAPLLEGEPMEAAPADEGEDRTLEPSSARELGRGHRRGEATPGIGEPTRESTRSIGPPPQPPLLPPRQGEAPEPPRTAYPRLDAPEQVTVGEEFEVVVGLAKKQQPGVAGPAMKLPPLPSLDLEVQVVAPGFRLRAGESWKQILRVTEQRPFPFTRLHLTAEAASEPTAEIQVFYAVAGQTRGLARRYLLVQQPEAPALRLAKPSLATGIDLAAPDAQDPVDLEVRISLDSTETRLSWTFASRHPLQSLSPSPDEKAIGPQARDFARLMIERIEQDDQSQDLGPRLRGVGMELGNRVPHRFWQLLAEARERAGKAPRVLLMTQEPYIPWELALVPPKFVEPKVPSFLGAQVEIGRWVFGDEWVPPRPPTRLEVGDLAVVTTKYTDDVAANLPHALEEGDELEKRYGKRARRVSGAGKPVRSCLQGSPPAEVLHFALHGKWDPASTQAGLLLADGRYLDSQLVQGYASPLQHRPFVYLNACQTGSGEATLGGYGGLASAFLRAQASAVVAPLWSVNDARAKEIALDFYQRVEEGKSPAAVLRELRASFDGQAKEPSAAPLAYQFFGHPSFKLDFGPHS